MTILFAWLLADFLTGLVHFAQDRLLLEPSRFLFINRIKLDNDLHHAKPAAMTRFSMWENINTSAPYTIPVAGCLFLLGCPTVIWLALFFASFANLVHRFAHLPKAKVPPLVKAVQWTGLFITFDHHHVHHFDKNGTIKKEVTTVRFCPMTNWLNPILDKVGLFMFIARMLNKRGPNEI